MLVQTPFRKSWECETTTSILSNFFNVSSSQTQASKSAKTQKWIAGTECLIKKCLVLWIQKQSKVLIEDKEHAKQDQVYKSSSCYVVIQSLPRWFVGSSSNNIVGFMKRALAKAILILQPPEKSRVFFSCICLVKPRPNKISAARFSAVDASIASKRSYRRSICSPPPSSYDDHMWWLILERCIVFKTNLHMLAM